jgi:hypothetical protein
MNPLLSPACIKIHRTRGTDAEWVRLVISRGEDEKEGNSLISFSSALSAPPRELPFVPSYRFAKWVRLVILFSRGDAEDAEPGFSNIELGTSNGRVERMGSFGKNKRSGCRFRLRVLCAFVVGIVLKKTFWSDLVGFTRIWSDLSVSRDGEGGEGRMGSFLPSSLCFPLFHVTHLTFHGLVAIRRHARSDFHCREGIKRSNRLPIKKEQ